LANGKQSWQKVHQFKLEIWSFNIGEIEWQFCHQMLSASNFLLVKKSLVKLTPSVNFINILQVHFGPIFWRQKLQD
jgi:hypothetical protein